MGHPVPQESYMLRKVRTFALVCISGCAVAAFAADNSKIDARLDNAKTVIDQIMSVPDKAIPNQIAEGATCIGVIPGVKKGAFVFGGEYGQGVVTCRTGTGWSAPVFIKLEGGSFGFQIGGQETDLVLVAVNQKGFQDLLKTKFKIGGDASAAAGPVGRDAQAGTNWKLQSELLTYSRAKGLFAGIDLNGAVIDQNTADTKALYGSDISFNKILSGSVPTPAAAQPFVRTIRKYFSRVQGAHKKA
jgi:lipid-binding SYLF domain-containing protein